MAKRKLEKAYSDWPRMAITKDGGVHLTGNYEHPGLNGNLVGGWFLSSMMIGGFTGGVGFILLALYLPMKPMLVSTFGKKLNIKLYTDRIELRANGRLKNFDRRYPIEFHVAPHHKAFDERVRARRGRTASKLYREAVEVVMHYGETRVPIAEFSLKDVEKANALVLRLQAVASSIDMTRTRKPNVTPSNNNDGEFGPSHDIV